MAQWDSSTFHSINGLNSGNRFAVTDYPTTDGFNYPIENTQYLHDNCIGVYAQSFTTAQKQQAKTNMGIGSGFDGSYDSLTGKPDLTNPQFQTINVNGQASIYGDNSKCQIACYDLQISEDFGDEMADVFSIREIYQRLNDLGFKSGSFTISGASSITATKNSIKKQGKRCIANLTVTFTATATSIDIIVPSGFRPKETTEIPILQLGPAFFHYLFNNLTYYVSTNGNIGVSNLTSGQTYTLEIINAGWEL